MAITKEQILGLLKKNPVGIACLGSFIVLAGYYAYRSSAIPEAEERLLAANQLADRLALNIKNSAQLPEQLKIVKDAVQEVNGRIIQASTLATNMQYFYKLVADTGTKLIDLHQGSVGAKLDAYTPISFAVTVQGDYAHVMSFLHTLEQGRYFCRVNTVSIAPLSGTISAAEDGSVELVSITVNLELLGVQT